MGHNGSKHEGPMLASTRETYVLEWVLVIVGILLIFDALQGKRILSQVDQQVELILGVATLGFAWFLYTQKTKSGFRADKKHPLYGCSAAGEQTGICWNLP